MAQDLIVVGLEIETYTGKGVSGHNCSFEYSDETFKRHVFMTVDKDTNAKYLVSFWHTEGECSSGWTTASWAHYSIVRVQEFPAYSFVPKQELAFLGLCSDDDVFNLNFIDFSHEGQDAYYPGGYYTVNTGMFNPVARTKTKPQVFIFSGASATGKSFLAAKLKDLQVYETDAAKELPALLPDDVIVVGRKYKHTIQDVLARIPEGTEPIFVNFAQ